MKKIKNYLNSKDFLQHLVLAILPSILLAVLFYANNLHLVHWDNSVFRLLKIVSIIFFIWIIFVKKIPFLLYLPLSFSFVFCILTLFPNFYYKSFLICILFFLCPIIFYFIKKHIRLVYIFLSSIIVSQIIQSVIKYKKENNIQRYNYSFSLKDYKQPLKKKYNIYYFLTDSYSSQNTLLTQDRLDNSPFINWLKSKGFSTNNNAYSNYSRTYTSMQATFEMKHNFYKNMDFYTTETPISRYIMQGANPVMSRLFNNGFSVYVNPFDQRFERGDEIISFSKKWNGKIEKKIDLDARKNDVYWFIKYLDKHINSINFMLKSDFNYSDKNQPIRTNLIEINHYENLNKKDFYLSNLLSIKDTNDKFVYLHYHLNLDYECNHKYAREEYICRIKSINYDLQKSIKYILSKESNPIIIIQSDHGGGPGNINGNLMQRRFGILFSVRWPKECAYLGKEKYTPVNLFPRVFACLNGEKPDYKNMVADDSYLIGAWSDDKNREPNEVFKVIENNEILPEFR